MASNQEGSVGDLLFQLLPICPNCHGLDSWSYRNLLFMELDAGKTKNKLMVNLDFGLGFVLVCRLKLCPCALKWSSFGLLYVRRKRYISFYKATDLTRLEPRLHPYNFFKHYIFSLKALVTSAFNTGILRTCYYSAHGSCCLASLPIYFQPNSLAFISVLWSVSYLQPKIIFCSSEADFISILATTNPDITLKVSIWIKPSGNWCGWWILAGFKDEDSEFMRGTLSVVTNS